MKNKILTTLIILAISITAMGQIVPGKFVFGGHITFQEEKNDDYYSALREKDNYPNSKIYTISPQVGWVVNNSLTVGLNLNYYHNDNLRIGYSDETEYGAGIFVRFHKSISDKFYLYIEPQIGLSYTRYSEAEMYNSINFASKVNIGFMYFFNEKLSLEFNLFNINYIYSKNDGIEYDYVDDRLSFSLDMTNPNIGLKYYL